MTYPTTKTKEEFYKNWKIDQGFGNKTSYSYHESPFLETWIFTIVTPCMNFAVARITNSFNILHNIIFPIHVKMMGNKAPFGSSFISSTHFTKKFSKLVGLFMRNSTFPVTVRVAFTVNQRESLTSIFSSGWRSSLARVRTVLKHSTESDFIPRRGEFVTTIQTIKNKLAFFSANKVWLIFSFFISHGVIISRSTKGAYI